MSLVSIAESGIFSSAASSLRSRALIVPPPLRLISLPRRDDADSFFAISILNRVGDQKDRNGSDEAQRLPAFFAIFVAALRGQMVRVLKNAPRQIEADAMLPAIGSILFRMPFELHLQIYAYKFVLTTQDAPRTP